jgi:hypothetical protein
MEGKGSTVGKIIGVGSGGIGSRECEAGSVITRGIKTGAYSVVVDKLGGDSGAAEGGLGDSGGSGVVESSLVKAL